MRKKMLGLMSIITLAVPFFTSASTTHAASYSELAAYWAPQIYQDVNADLDVRADFITNFNYDGDYLARNNWDNLSNYNENAYVYYKVSETTTHYFIEYDLFHARDDAYTRPLDAHENDLEGLFLVIKKDGSNYGSFQLMETMAHNQWYDYTNDPNITSGTDNVDGGVLFNGSHPMVFCQANGQSPSGGHGVKAYDGSSAPGGDGIVYDYTGVAQFPTNTSGSYTNHYGYALIEWGDLWSRRNNPNIFASWGTFAGDNNTANSANAPWGWDDSDDGPALQGMNWSDPAHQVDVHLNGLGNFSHTYVFNPYYSHKIVLQNTQSLEDRDPFGGKSDIYIKAYVNGQGQTDARFWKKNDAPKNQVYNIAFGANDAEFGANFSENYNTVYVAKPSNTNVEIHVYDSDGTSGDDDMGYVSAVVAPGTTKSWTDALTSNGQAKVTATVTAQ
ncbi:hypothetical protein HZF08_36010 [Paenibacillus sp. CGMCC 1.16610]|uniref:C2 domain-containing protein n=1 Tax=Paenibacillus anseongense TaxID=2682845 RepID=A0ABW9UE92_9BACL|nr:MULTISPECIES: hypothetical protein [Paenibacillus]MBA2943683.1 hypothetical protein [Paenibacillus sp. CGMCC 1.16610]MVQ37589.1 hypothetical protein [Paenibacillus anseongense]